MYAGCCVLHYLDECWFNVCWFSGHMVLTESSSHIVAAVLSKKLDRSWRWGWGLLSQPSEERRPLGPGGVELWVSDFLQGSPASCEGMLLTTYILTHSEKRDRKNVKQITTQQSAWGGEAVMQFLSWAEAVCSKKKRVQLREEDGFPKGGGCEVISRP